MKLNKFAYLYSKPLGNRTLKIMKKIPGNLLKNLEKSWKNHEILSVRKSGNPDYFPQRRTLTSDSITSKYPLLRIENSNGEFRHCGLGGGGVRLFTVRKRSCRKVMFSQACVKNFVHRGRGEVYTPQGDTPSPWPGRHPPPGRRLLQRTIRILLDCILVLHFNA